MNFEVSQGALAITVLACLSGACSPPAMPEVSRTRKIVSQCEPTAEDRYFGAAELQLPPHLSKSELTAPLSTILDAMREPSLSCGAGLNSYRVVWIHSFSAYPRTISRYPPTSIRISEKNGTWSVTGVQLSSAVNRTELVRRERTLTQSESFELLNAIAQFELWRRKDYAAEEGVHDGETWIVEGRRNNGYQAAFLTNSDREACRKLGAAFLRAAAIDPSILNGR